MTVSSASNKITFAGNGSATNFPFTFSLPASDTTNVQVYFTDALGNITLLAPSTYTVTINPPVSPNPTSVGGTVTYNPSGVPIPLGTFLTILRTLPFTQPISFVNQGALYPSIIESGEDQQVMLDQQLSELLGRQITVAVSDPNPAALPPVAQRANLIMGFDASGNPTAVAAAPAGVISSAMAPFVGAATLAAAKALLGYGTMANENVGAAGRGLFDDGSGNARTNQTISAVSANQSVGLANHLTYYVSSGASLVYTLAALSTLFQGFEFTVVCLSGSVVLTPNAANNFQSFGGGVSVTIVAGQVAHVVGGATAWVLELSKLQSVGGPTMQVLTSGSSATYNTPAGCTRLKIRMIGAGGGGGGTGNPGATSGGTGGTTAFNAITCIGGGGGQGNTTSAAVAGGIGGTGGAGAAALRFNGGAGMFGLANTAGTITQIGGTGGGTPFAGGGQTNSGVAVVVANSGVGGGGGFDPTAAGAGGGGGGGAGEYAELIINNPVATYTYTIGTGGTAGAAGTGGNAGVAGAAGVVIVEEFYGA